MAPPRTETRRALLRLLLIAFGVYALICAAMAVNQRSFIYPALLPGIAEPKEAGLEGYSRRQFTAADKTTITYWEADGRTHKPLLFYFHGNGGGLHMFVPALAFLREQGFHVIALEYRGYPGAGGRATQIGIVQDGIALRDHFHQQYPKQPVVIWGYSLGTGVANQVAATQDPSVLVLEAPFTAVVDRAHEMFPWLPVRWILRDQYRSREVITRIHAPVFMMHGEADYIIPVAHGKALFALANPPKTLNLYPEAGHLNLIDYGAYEDATAFIRQHVKWMQ